MGSAKIWLSGIILALCLQACFSVRSDSKFTYSKLNPGKYDTCLHDSSPHYLIDVRTGAEYRKGHMAGADNYNFLAFHFGRDVDTLDRNKVVFLYCQTCHRSPFAARIMKKKGFKRVYDLKGGYAKWCKTRQKQKQ
jgi:rhodanese-related sulfurtransferase